MGGRKKTAFYAAIKTSITLYIKRGIKFRFNDTLKQQSNSPLRGVTRDCFQRHIKLHEEYFRAFFPLDNSPYCLS
jgi:hypothetical protein